MDPALSELYEAGSADDEVSVILRLEDETKVPPAVRIVSRFGPIKGSDVVREGGAIITARIRRGDIPAAWRSDAVASLKAPRPVWNPAPLLERGLRALAMEADSELDSSDELDSEDELDFDEPTAAFESDDSEFDTDAEVRSKAAAAALPRFEEDGRGVIVALCDWGFDFTHPNFRNPDGSTRLLCLWDQRGEGDPRAPAPFNYGRLHTREAINAALDTADPCAALDYHPASGDPTNTGAHGTHVADIAAGNRREPGSRVGLASGADLVFVHLGAQRLRELENLGDSACLLEALDFIRRQAAGRPCVINLSAGKTAGPHRGNTPLEIAVDVMLAGEPGLALVQSAGNYGATAMHTHARIGPDQEHVLDWIIPKRDRTPNELEIWYGGHDVFDVKLVSPTGQEFSIPLGERLRINESGALWGNLYHRRFEPNSGLNHVDFFLQPNAPAGRWRVVLRGRDVIDGRLHAWIERDAGSRYQSRFSRRQATARYTTNTICNSLRAIAVGAYDGTRPDRPPTRFTSLGPTADGRQKPDVAAPGERILAARSMPRQGWQGESRLAVKSGTSMAAPYVAGAVALMMQAAGRPLTIHEVRRILIGTADRSSAPSGRSSSRLGYGYVDVDAALRAARAMRTTTLRSPPESADEPANDWAPRSVHPAAELGAPSTELREEVADDGEFEATADGWVDEGADPAEDDRFDASAGDAAGFDGADRAPDARDFDAESELVSPGDEAGLGFDQEDLRDVFEHDEDIRW